MCRDWGDDDAGAGDSRDEGEGSFAERASWMARGGQIYMHISYDFPREMRRVEGLLRLSTNERTWMQSSTVAIC